MRRLICTLAILLSASPLLAIDTVCAGVTTGGCDQVQFTTNSIITIEKVIFPDASEITSANGLGGGVATAASLNLRMANTFTSITTAIAAGDLTFQLIAGTGVWKVDLGTVNSKIDLFLSTGQQIIREFDLFRSTGEAGIRAFLLYQSTGEQIGREFDLFRSTAEAKHDQFTLFLATAEAEIDNGGGGGGVGAAFNAYTGNNNNTGVDPSTVVFYDTNGLSVRFGGSSSMTVLLASTGNMTMNKLTALTDVVATSFTANGNQSPVFGSTWGVFQIQLTDSNDSELTVGETSVTVSGNLIYVSTFSTPFGPYRWVTLASSTYEMNFPTMPAAGRAHFDPTHSSETYMVTEIDLPENIVANSTPILTYALSVSTGKDAGTHIWGISMATVGAGGLDPYAAIYRSTMVFTASGDAGATATTARTAKNYTTNIALSGWNQYTGSGRRKLLIRVTSLGGTSTVKRWFDTAIIDWARQK